MSSTRLLPTGPSQWHLPDPIEITAQKSNTIARGHPPGVSIQNFGGIVEPTAALLDREALHRHRAETGARLRGLAEQCQPAAQDDLLALACAVEDGGTREAPWRGVALSRLFSASSVFVAQRTTGLIRLLSVLAAVIVFFPIGWTWIGLRAAVSQYREALLDRSAEGQSLLQLWTSGFDGVLPAHLTLPSVAFGSAVLIAVSALLVIIERLVATRAEWQLDEEERQFEAELNSALLAAELTLAMNIVDTPEKGLDLVRESIENVIAANMSLGDTAKELSAAAADMAIQTAAASGSFEHAATSISSSLTAAASEAGGTLQGAIQQAGEGFRHTARASVQELTHAVSALSAATAEHSRTASESTSVAQSLAVAAEAITSNTRDFGDQVTASTLSLSDQMTASADELRTTVGPAVLRISDEVVALNGFTSGLQDALAHHTTAAQHQITELTQIRSSLAQLADPKIPKAERNGAAKHFHYDTAEI